MMFERRRTASAEELFSQELEGLVTGGAPDDLLRVAETLRSAASSVGVSAGLHARRGAVLSSATRPSPSLRPAVQSALLAASVALGSAVGLVGASVTTSWLDSHGGSPAGDAPEPTPHVDDSADSAQERSPAPQRSSTPLPSPRVTETDLPSVNRNITERRLEAVDDESEDHDEPEDHDEAGDDERKDHDEPDDHDEAEHDEAEHDEPDDHDDAEHDEPDDDDEVDD